MKKNFDLKEDDNKQNNSTDAATSKDTPKKLNIDEKSSNKKKESVKTTAKESKKSQDKTKTESHDHPMSTLAEETKRFLGRNKKLTLPKDIIVTPGKDTGISKYFITGQKERKKSLQRLQKL